MRKWLQDHRGISTCVLAAGAVTLVARKNDHDDRFHWRSKSTNLSFTHRCVHSYPTIYDAQFAAERFFEAPWEYGSAEIARVDISPLARRGEV